MSKFVIHPFEDWLPGLREKLNIDGKKRFMLLLIFFNALLAAILVLSVRNQEILQRIRIVEDQIARQVERLATVRANLWQTVYITATPSPSAVAAATQTPTSTATLPPEATSTPASTREPTATPTPTQRPTRTLTLTPSPTLSPTPTVTLTLPTATPSLTPTWTPTPSPTTPVPPTDTPPPEPFSVALTVSHDTITANGSSTSLIEAQVLDQYGNPVPDGTQVTFATDRGTFWGAATVVALTSGGRAQAPLTSSCSAGVATVSVTAGRAWASIQVTFIPGPPHTLVLSASADRTLVGETLVLQALVRDQCGNPVADRTPVTFAVDLGILGSANVRTLNGVAETTLTGDAAGVATVTATAGGRSDTLTVRFMPLIRIAKSVDRDTAPAGSALIYTIVIRNASPGGDAALLHTLTDQPPAGFAYVPDSTTSPAFPGNPAVDGQNLTWTASPSPYSLSPGGTIETSFRVLAQVMPGTYSNRATVAGGNFDPVSTGNAAPVTLSGPALSQIAPSGACNDAPVAVTISGASFAPGLTARLGPWALVVTWVDEYTLNATVPRDIAAGAYDLVVTNPGGSTDTLALAYTAQNCVPPTTTLDSGFLGTYGAEPALASRQGDDDQLQVLFLEVPASVAGPLYIRVFDPDCGGTLDMQNGWAWDTSFDFTIYGGLGAFSDADARSAHPTAGAYSGTPLDSQVFAENSGTDAGWYTFGPLQVTDGEQVGANYVFKLTVTGGPRPPSAVGSWADLNIYNVALSTSPTTNSAPVGSRVFAYSWTFLIPTATYRTPPRVFPYVGSNVTTFIQHNWDYDNNAPGAAGITMTTPVRTIVVPDTYVSSDDEGRSSEHATLDDERNTTWAVDCWAAPLGVPLGNLVTFWATDQNGTALATFSRSTIGSPPQP